MHSKRDRAHLKVVKNYHVYISLTGKVPNIYDVISYIMTSSPWRSLLAWRVTYTKQTNAKYTVKAEISMKTITFNYLAKGSAFSAG